MSHPHLFFISLAEFIRTLKGTTLKTQLGLSVDPERDILKFSL